MAKSKLYIYAIKSD